MGAQATGWALFRDGVQISKAHPHRAIAVTEAYERGAYVTQGAWSVLAAGYEIRQVPHGA